MFWVNEDSLHLKICVFWSKNISVIKGVTTVSALATHISHVKDFQMYFYDSCVYKLLDILFIFTKNFLKLYNTQKAKRRKSLLLFCEIV